MERSNGFIRNQYTAGGGRAHPGGIEQAINVEPTLRSMKSHNVKLATDRLKNTRCIHIYCVRHSHMYHL